MFTFNFPFIRFILSYINWLKKTNQKLTENVTHTMYRTCENVKINKKNLLHNVKVT